MRKMLYLGVAGHAAEGLGGGHADLRGLVAGQALHGQAGEHAGVAQTTEGQEHLLLPVALGVAAEADLLLYHGHNAAHGGVLGTNKTNTFYSLILIKKSIKRGVFL